MDFWIFMFIIVLVIPIAMIGIGLLFINLLNKSILFMDIGQVCQKKIKKHGISLTNIVGNYGGF